MASFTFQSVADRFPSGTSVAAYPKRSQIVGRAPSGTSAATATVSTDGSLTFSGLSDGTDYVAYALVGGEHRYISFSIRVANVDEPLRDGDAPWSGMSERYPSKRNGLRRSVHVSDYIDGSESASTQAAAMNQALVDMAERGLKEIRFGAPTASGVSRWQIDNRVWVGPSAVGARILGDGAEILRTDWIVAGITNGLHFDQHSDAESVVFDDFNLTHEGSMPYTTSFAGSWRGSNHYLKAAGIFICASGTHATRIRGYGRSTLVFVNDYVSAADGSDTDTADRTGTVENFHLEDIEGIDPATGNPCNNVTLVEGATRGGFIGKHRGTHSDPSGTTPTGAFPGHMVYVSGSAGDHKGLTGGDWSTVGGRGRGANHAYSLKGIESGVLTGLVARDCEGLATLQECGRGLTVAGVAAHGDIADVASGSTLEVKLSSEGVNVEGVQINRATAGQALVIDGPNNTVRDVRITLDDVSTTTSVIAFNSSGDGSRVLGVDIQNLDTVGCPAAIVNNDCANAHIEFKRAVNVIRLCNFGTGTDGSSVSYDPATVTLMTSTGATDDTLGNPAGYATVSGSGTNVRQSSRSCRRAFAVTTGAWYPYWNPSLEDELYIEATGNGSVNVSNFPAGDSPALFNGKRLRLTIRNASGGTMGPIAWASDWVLSGPTPNRPTNGNELVMTFAYRDGLAYEVPGTRAYSNLASDPVTVTLATDQAETITPTSMGYTVLHTGTLTAARTMTLTTTAMQPGARIRFVRTGAGAFNLNIGTGPLKALATGAWCEVIFDGSAWVLAASGSL